MKEVIVKLSRGKIERIMKSVIKDGMSVTSFNDKTQARNTFETMKRAGTNCSFRDDCIIQFFLNKSESEIVEMAKQQVNQMAKGLDLKMEIQTNDI